MFPNQKKSLCASIARDTTFRVEVFDGIFVRNEVNAVKSIIHRISLYFSQKFKAKITAFVFIAFTESDLNTQEVSYIIR